MKLAAAALLALAAIYLYRFVKGSAYAPQRRSYDNELTVFTDPYLELLWQRDTA